MATWLAAIWLAWRFAWVLEPWLEDWLATPELTLWTARVIVFLAVLIAGALLARLARTLIRATGLTGTDRMLGGLFGVARGVLIVGLLVIVLELAGLGQDPRWQSAQLKPFGDRVAAAILHYAEIGARYLEERNFGARTATDR